MEELKDILINYIILLGKRDDISPLYIPENMHQEELRWLPALPQSIAHYLSGSSLLEALLNVGGKRGLKVTWVYEDSYDEMLSARFQEVHPGLKVFVVSVSSKEETIAVTDFLQKLPDDGSSVAFSITKRINAPIPVATGRDRLLDLIDVYAAKKFPTFYQNKKAPHTLKDSLDNGFLFNPTVPNTEILHAALGDFRFRVNQYTVIERQLESSAAIEQEDTFNRQIQLISQLKSFDRLDAELFTSDTIATWLIEQRKAPLIISMPYNSKDVVDAVSVDVPKEFKSIQKAVKTALKIGQTKNYTVPKSIVADEIIGSASALLLPRSRYLDILCGLHSSLRISPILRLPAVGSAFNKQLSWVGPVASGRLMAPNKKQSLIKTISSIGREMANLELSEQARDFIRESKRQIVAVTDLPIEWMEIDGMPLAFSHDVCRLPEVPYAIAMQHYVIDSHGIFRVPKDILSKTLVVFGTSDKHFLPFQEQTEKEAAKLGYKTIRPRNVKELSDRVRDFQPLLIVFDTHGSYNSRTHETSIQIGEETLKPDDIQSQQIVAPLIFLSACNTAPLYNLTKTIVNSFVATGALSVTASYMPLSIMESSITYMRMLRLLKEAATKCIHKNWLSFISYVLRTSAVHESFLSKYEPSGKGEEERPRLEHTEMIIKALQFDYRRDVYNQLRKGIKVDGKKISFQDLIPHYLMYTTIGRADLIDFEASNEAIREALGQ